MRFAAHLVTISLAFATMCPSIHAADARKPDDIRSKFSKMLELQKSTIGLNTSETDKAFETFYAKNFVILQSAAKLKTASLRDVQELLKSALFAATYNRYSRPALDSLRDLEELKLRHAAIEDNFVETYNCLITARLFREAQLVKAEYSSPLFGTLPKYEDVSISGRSPTVLTLSSNMKRLIRSSFDLRAGNHIVIVSTPLCHFCQRAAHDIDADNRLRRLMHRNATWLCAVTDAISFEDVHEWNESHPNDRMVIAYKMQEWPQIEQWATPIFYFFKNGNLVKTVTGWPSGGNKRNVIAAFQEAYGAR